MSRSLSQAVRLPSVMETARPATPLQAQAGTMLFNYLLAGLAGTLLVLCVLSTSKSAPTVTRIEWLLTAASLSAIFILSAWRPHVAIYIFVATMVLNGLPFLTFPEEIERKMFFSYYHFMLAGKKVFFFELVLLAGFLGSLFHLLLCGSSRWRQLARSLWGARTLLLFAFLFAGVGLLSILRGIPAYGVTAAIGDGRLALSVGALFLGLLCLQPEHPPVLARLYLWCTLGRVGINLLTPLLNPAYQFYHRTFGSGTDSAYFAVGGVCLLLWTVRYSQANRPRALLAAAVLLGAAVLTTSRSGLLAVLMGLGALTLLLPLSGKLKAAVALAVISILVFFSIPLRYAQQIQERYASGLQFSADPNVAYRFASWEHGLRMVEGNLLLGDGFGSYSERFVSGFWEKADLHNAYLEVASRMGLIGLALFLALLLWGVWKSWQVFRSKESFMAEAVFVTLAMLAVFLFFNAEMREARAGYLLWLTLAASAHLRREQTA